MTKKIVGFLAIFALSGIFFQTNVGTSEVHAQSTVQTNTSTTPTSVSTMWLVDILDLILKVVYILLWPLLVVAGWAMDNTLVYGSIFNLDVPLWKFRNILKNFANFTLWFLVLFAILKSIFTNSGIWTLKDGKTPLGIIKKALVAGILIQASWFLLAATIDVSTVATYAVGWLPLSVLKTTALWQRKILAVDANIDLNKIQNLNDKWDILSLTYAAWPHKLSACKISNDMCSTTGDNRYIIWRKQMSGTEMGKCVFGGNMVISYDETWFQNDASFQARNYWYRYFVEWINLFCVSPSQWETRVSKWFVVDLYSWSSFSGAKVAWQKRFDGTPAMMLSELVTRSKWFVWPMVTIYSSLLNFAEISDGGNDSFGKISGEMIIRTGFALMLFFPLLALAVVLIIRVGFLWLIIAASPFIVLLEVFKETLKLPADFSLSKHLEFGNIISVIFAPVVTVFMLSLSVIFITTLISTLTPDGAHNNAIDAILAPQIVKQPTTDGTQKYLVWGSQMTLSNFNRWGSLDWFSWIIVNLISLWLMRALVFAAIKFNTIGKSIWWKIQEFGGNFMTTLPIFNTPRGKAGVWAIASMPDKIIWDGNGSSGWIVDKMKAQDLKAIETFKKNQWRGEDDDAGATTKNTLTSEQITKVITAKTADDAKAQFTAAGVTDISAALTSNGTAIYDAIITNKDLYKTDGERKKALDLIRWNTDNKTWYEAIATTKFESLISIEDKDMEEAAVDKLLADNKLEVEKYFSIVPKDYEKVIGKAKFTIPRKPVNWVFKVTKTAITT